MRVTNIHVNGSEVFIGRRPLPIKIELKISEEARKELKKDNRNFYSL